MVREVAFRSEGETVRAVWTHPDGPPTGSRPTFILCPDCALTQDIGLPGVARWLQAAGYGSLRLDYRGWGGSEGTPRGVIHPDQQVDDVRAAVTFLQLQRDVDAAHIGVMGWGLGGGVALQAGALDGRIGAVLAVNPVGDGERWLAALHGLGIWRKWRLRLAQDRLNRSRTDYSEYVPALGPRQEATGEQLHAPLFPVGTQVATWLDAQPSGTVASRAPRFVPLQSADRIAAFRPERFLDLLAGRGACVVAHAEDSLVGITEALACARTLRGDALRLAPPGLIRDRHELWAPSTLAWLARQVSEWLVRWLPISNDPWQSPAASSVEARPTRTAVALEGLVDRDHNPTTSPDADNHGLPETEVAATHELALATEPPRPIPTLSSVPTAHSGESGDMAAGMTDIPSICATGCTTDVDALTKPAVANAATGVAAAADPTEVACDAATPVAGSDAPPTGDATFDPEHTDITDVETADDPDEPAITNAATGVAAAADPTEVTCDAATPVAGSDAPPTGDASFDPKHTDTPDITDMQTADDPDEPAITNAATQVAAAADPTDIACDAATPVAGSDAPPTDDAAEGAAETDPAVNPNVCLLTDGPSANGTAPVDDAPKPATTAGEAPTPWWQIEQA